jgi:hypothetical protein
LQQIKEQMSELNSNIIALTAAEFCRKTGLSRYMITRNKNKFQWADPDPLFKERILTTEANFGIAEEIRKQNAERVKKD